MKTFTLLVSLGILLTSHAATATPTDANARETAPAHLAIAVPAATFPAKGPDNSPSANNELARTISQITGVAISPLLGTSAMGAWRYFETPEAQRPHLPWFAQPWFWAPALIIVGLVFAKDAFGPATPASLKKPIDLLEMFENKISGLIVAGAFVPLVVGIFGADHVPGTAALDAASAGFAAATGSQFINILLTPFALIAFIAVWLLGHVVHVLILLSPFTTVDSILKLLRTALLATVVGTSFASPTAGALWALAIIAVSLFLAGWTFRLTLLGNVFLFDVLSRRRRWFHPDPASTWLFLAQPVGEAPLRSYGRLTRTSADSLVFKYRNFMVGPEREVSLPGGSYCIGRGFIYADLLAIAGDESHRAGIFPPRFKGHESEITRIYGLAEPRDVGLRGLLRALRELVRGSPTTTSSTRPASP